VNDCRGLRAAVSAKDAHFQGFGRFLIYFLVDTNDSGVHSPPSPPVPNFKGLTRVATTQATNLKSPCPFVPVPTRMFFRTHPY
jgi:hypothetical protein